MGNRPIHSIFDLAKANAHLRVTCLKCEHSALMDRTGLHQLFRQKGWTDNLEACGGRFRCQKCGHLGARLRAEVYAACPPAPARPLTLPDPVLKASLDRLLAVAELQTAGAIDPADYHEDVSRVAPFLGLHGDHDLMTALAKDHWSHRRRYLLRILERVEDRLPRMQD